MLAIDNGTSFIAPLLAVGRWLLQSPDATVLLLVSAFGLYQYRRDQNWKRKEFAFQTLKNLRDLPVYRDMLRVLAWDDCHSETLGEATITRAQVVALLDVDGNGANEADKKILYAVDEFLTELDMFLFYVRRDLMRWDDVKQHLGYVVALLGENSATAFPAGERGVLLSRPTKVLRKVRPVRIGYGAHLDDNPLAGALVAYCRKWDYENVLWTIARYAPAPRSRAPTPRPHADDGRATRVPAGQEAAGQP